MKKSLYIFLCSLLGLLTFLILHRLLVFFYLLLASNNPEIFYGRWNYLEMVATDFFTLMVVMMLGAWYGIALGLKWYEAVYERGYTSGLIDHIVKTYWPSHKGDYDLPQKVQNVVRELKDDVLELEHLAKTIKPVMKEMTPIKRRIVRKKAVGVAKQV